LGVLKKYESQTYQFLHYNFFKDLLDNQTLRHVNQLQFTPFPRQKKGLGK